MKVSKHFSRKEFACKCGCGFDVVDVELVQILEEIREHFDQPIIITGPNRCSEHNSKVGGASKSMHAVGMAVDFKVEGVKSGIVADYLEGRFSDKYGVGRYRSWTHLDVRFIPARWEG